MKWQKVRWLLAAGCLYLSGKLMTGALRIEAMTAERPVSGLPAAPYVIFSVFTFVFAVLLLSPETVFRIAEWCSRPFAAIFFPSDRFTKPPLTYKLARRYRGEKRWKDAARQYRKIIRYYPREADAYIELVEVAEQMGDRELKQEYAALFRKQFKTTLSKAASETHL